MHKEQNSGTPGLSDLDQILRQRLSFLNNEYVSQLDSRLSEIKNFWAAARFGLCQSDEILNLSRVVADLVTSGSTLGLAQIPDQAHKLGLFITSLMGGEGLISEEHRWQCESLIQTLEYSILNRQHNRQNQKQERWKPEGLFPGLKDDLRLVYILEANTRVANQISNQLNYRDYQTEIFDNIQALRLAVEKVTPVVIITNQLIQDNKTLGNRLLQKNMYGFKAEIPIIYVSPQDDIDSRLKAVRSGATYYFAHPLDIKNLCRKVDELTTGIPKEPYRIMIVDDDPIISNFYALILEQEGMTVTVLNDPGKTMEMIDKANPELILLDIYMPNCSGLELTTIIRQQEKYAGISIILLSAEADYERQLAAKKLGGDDFLTKPVDPDYLVATISSRVYRARTLNTMNINLLNTMRELENQQFALDQHAIVSITNINGEIIYVNDKFCDISGYNKTELIGKNHKILKSGRHSIDYYERMWKTISQGKVWQGEVCNTKESGDLYWVNVTIVPFMDESMRPYQYVAISSDISSRIMAEQNLLMARDTAVKANQAKSDFLSKMSHELRTPLNAIMGFSQLLDAAPDNPLSEAQALYLKEITNASEHLLNLINEVLDLSRIEANQLKVENINIPLSAFLDECTALIAPIARNKGITLFKNYVDNNRLAVLADPIRLKQIMVNLLSNGVKYNSPRGSIDIRTRPDKDDGIIIEVIDSGHGITQDQINQLFQPFTRLPQHKSEEGTGIGLALSKKLVELMGGEIGVKSQIGKGSKFWIRLQQTVAETEEYAEPAKLPARRKTIKKSGIFKILYIEDNLVNHSLIKEILKQRPEMQLLHAETAESGIEMVKASHPDMILMDINLPGMDGFECLKLLRNDADIPKIPVIAISAYASNDNIQQAISAGFDDYITKPIEIKEFLDILDSVANDIVT